MRRNRSKDLSHSKKPTMGRWLKLAPMTHFKDGLAPVTQRIYNAVAIPFITRPFRISSFLVKQRSIKFVIVLSCEYLLSYEYLFDLGQCYRKYCYRLQHSQEGSPTRLLKSPTKIMWPFCRHRSISFWSITWTAPKYVSLSMAKCSFTYLIRMRPSC